jgi:signal transduction histidine kinase
MSNPTLIEQLAAHRTIGGVPRHELEWLAAHGSVQQIKKGEVVSTKGTPLEHMHVVLSGLMAIFIERGAAVHKTIEWRGGDIAGTLPYSRLTTPPGNSVALEATTVLSVPKECFTEMVRECPELTAIAVHIMLDRARTFTSTQLLDEKLVSLGKMSAGLAHELNNPASAIERNAALLQRRLGDADAAARTLGASRLTEEQLEAVDALRNACVANRASGVRSPIEQAEREEQITDWMTDHGLDPAAADALAETAVTIEALDRVAALVDGPALDAAIRSASAGCSVRSLAEDIHLASTRITGLVFAIKGFTHMDKAATAEPVDLPSGVANTVTVLRAKARDKAATVAVDMAPDLPRVRGFVGELNQVWSNLLDNALDAVPRGGRVEISARREHDHVVVRVVDDGPGIPAEIKDRVFDPFFTTKSVGHGMGLGLDRVNQLVRHNEGRVVVDSKPGRTEFAVMLPIADDSTDGSSDAPTDGRAT